jgi:integrase/recombinase XerD
LASISQEEVLAFLISLTKNNKQATKRNRFSVLASIKVNTLSTKERIFPISYVAAWSMVKKSGNLVNIELRPHDLRRHAATYASRSGNPIEIVSKVILRHADLSTTQRYLGKVNDSEAIRWIETFYG